MNHRPGYLAMVAATVIWGNLLLLFAYLDYVPFTDVIAHRVIWGLLTLLIWLGVKRRLGEIPTALRQPKIAFSLLISAILVAANWLGFVWAVANHHGLEAGLGYFIFPLVSIAFGALINHEKLDPLQILSIAIATCGVAILAYGLGRLPWISIYLAISFALYSLAKSRIQVGAVISVAVENLLIAPIALIWLISFAQYGFDFGRSANTAFWLILAGVLTALALIGFSFATKTIGLVATGMLFFINPTIQVLNAAFILGEPLLIWHKVAFPLIWLACGIYCYDLWRRAHAPKLPVT